MTVRRLPAVQIAAAAAAVSAGKVIGGHWAHVATTALIYAVAAAGLALVVARVGLVSLGHAAFFAAGAYTTGVLTRDHGWPIPMGICAALAVGLLLGFVVGRCALRTRGIAFVMVTMAAGEVTRVFGQQARGITGGDTGLASIPAVREPVIGVVAAVVLVTVVAMAWWLLATTFGRSIDAARQDEAKAAAMGVNIMAARTAVFTLSAGIVAVAGALLAHHSSFASPSLASWSKSGHLLVMVLIGGGRTITGAVLAAVGLTYTEEYVESHSDRWDLVLGALFISVVLFGVVSRGDSGVRGTIKRRLGIPRPSTIDKGRPALAARSAGAPLARTLDHDEQAEQ